MIGYVAKDKDGLVYFYLEKPVYDDEAKVWYSDMNMLDITGKFPEFDSMSYTDKPIKVKVEIKLERI